MNHCGRNFTGHEEIIFWNYDKNAQYGSEAWQRKQVSESKLEQLLNEFDSAYRAFIESGNNAGFVQIDNIYTLE